MTSRRWPALTAAALLLSLVAACSQRSAVLLVRTSAPPAPTPVVTGPPTITLDFAGDVHFEDRTLKLLSDPSTAFGPVADILKQADVSMVNLESSVTDRGTAEPKTFHFRAPTTAYAAIKAAGVDLVTVANNHALDYGRVGLDDTLTSAAAAHLPMIGAGQNADQAYKAWVTTVKGVKIAYVAMSQIAELSSSWAATDSRSGIAMAFDTKRAVAAVQAARAQADVVVVYLHWGQEYSNCPTGEMKTLAKTLSAAGATMLVGTHAHVLVGDGWQGKTFVNFGLSNFLWWLNDAGSNDTGVLRVTLSGSVIAKTEFVPAYIDRSTGQPVPSTGPEAARIVAKQAALRPCTGLASSPS